MISREEKGKEKEEQSSESSYGLNSSTLGIFYQAEFNADWVDSKGRSNISDKDLAALAQTSKEALGFFAPILKKRRIEKLLRHIVSGLEKDVIEIKKLLEANPLLLLEAADVTNRANVLLKHQLPYECAIGEGDDELAAIIAEYYKRIPDGEKLKAESDALYAPHIKKMADEFESGIPAYDVRPLIELIKQSSAEDIQAALQHDMTRKSKLRDALIVFRDAVKAPKEIVVGMHYKHHSTLKQALDLLGKEWKSLSRDYSYFDKCELVWYQVIGYLQLGLPAIDRIVFARAFQDKVRTLECIWQPGVHFLDTPKDLSGVGVGFDMAIFGARRRGEEVTLRWESAFWRWRPIGNFMSSKSFKLAELMQPLRAHEASGRQAPAGWCVIC